MKISMQNMAIDSFAPVLQSLSKILDKGGGARNGDENRPRERSTGARHVYARATGSDRVRSGERLRRASHRQGTAGPMTAVAHGLDEQTFGDLKARIATTIVTLASAEAADFEGSEDRDCSVQIPNGGGVIVMNGLQYLRSWALPHFYFHVVTAYDILRHHGVELGKRDYMGHVGAFIRRSENEPAHIRGGREYPPCCGCLQIQLLSDRPINRRSSATVSA